MLPRLATDLLELLWAAAQGRLGGFRLAVRPESAICVVVAARGYPGAYPKGDRIGLPPAAALPPGTAILHAGTAQNAAGKLVTNGGRVLGVVAVAPSLRAASDRAYSVCEQIRCETKYFRRDIGARHLEGA